MLLAAFAPSVGFCADYVYQPFTIAGESDVAVTAINDSGIAVGTYMSPTAGKKGFVGRRGQITTLPLAKSSPGTTGGGIPLPTGINDEGVVIGFDNLGYDSGGGTSGVSFFIWQNTAYTYLLGFGDYAAGAFIGSGNRLCYGGFDGARGYGFSAVGVPRSQQIFTAPPAFDGVFHINNVNKSGIVAGQYTMPPYYLADNVVFTAQGATPKTINQLTPPGAGPSFGGWINGSKQVAGSYFDERSHMHGFLFTQGSYATFDAPEPADAIMTSGIDETGRVVGTYIRKDLTYGFVYSGGAVTKLLPFAGGTQVQVSTSTLGRYIAITATDTSGTVRSWLAHCKAGAVC